MIAKQASAERHLSSIAIRTSSLKTVSLVSALVGYIWFIAAAGAV
jgi:hypothetical protein